MNGFIGVAAIAMLSWPMAVAGDEPAPPGVRRVAESVEAAVQGHRAAIERAKDDGDRLAERERWGLEQGRLVAEGIDEARKHPGGPASFDLLSRLYDVSTDLADMNRLREVIFRDFLGEKRLGPACLQLSYASRSPEWPKALAWLKAVAEGSPHREVRGAAWYALGLVFQDLADIAWYASRKPGEAEPGKFLDNMMGGPDQLRSLLGQGREAFARRAEEAFAKVASEYADVALESGRALGDRADRALFELRNLAVGKVAPEIEGDDLDGRKMALGDFRGKVVVVNFWGTWCPPCMGLVPEERELVAEMAGKPFALLGVSSDPDLAKIKRVMADNGMSWPSWRNDGRTDGPISSRWNVRGWPTVYVLDGDGVIRWKRPSFPHRETLRQAVEAVVIQEKPKR